MIICEFLLIIVLVTMMVLCSISDCKKSIIPNRLLVIAAVFAILTDVIYYIVFARDCFVPFVLNLALLTVIGMVFYCFNLWAAGDSKMLLVIGLYLPGRFYDFWPAGLCSSFAIVVLVFSIAFLYMIAESLIIGIRSRNLFQITFSAIPWKQWVITYFAMVSAVLLFNFLLSLFIGDLLSDNIFLATAVSFLTVLTAIQIREHIPNRALYIWAVVSWGGLILSGVFGVYPLRLTIDIKSWVLALLIMFARMVAEKYNYQVIPTSTVHAGQILSAATILGFNLSKVRGLPKGATEDLRSRITEDEAESVRRWENSAHGKSSVAIVRKIPFAIFICIGTMIFLGIEVFMLWYNR